MTEGTSLTYSTSEQRLAEVQPSATSMADVSGPPSELSLSDVERSVVRLSRADTLTSLADRGSWKASFRRVFGTDASNPLADPRLETLRHFAVILRLGRQVRKAEIDKFHDAGFDAHQWAQIDQMVAPWRKPPSQAVTYAPAIILLIAAALTYRWVAASLDDHMIGLIAACLEIIVLAPFLLPTSGRQ